MSKVLLSRRAACVALGNLLLACESQQREGATPAVAPSAPDRLSAVQIEAIGRITDVPAPVRGAYSGKGFEPPPPPRPGDWLSRQHEPGQNFDGYIRTFPQVPRGERNTLVLQPLGELAVNPEIIREYLEAFFAIPVVLSPADNSEGWTALSRTDKVTQHRHRFASDVLQYIRPRLPPRGFMLVGMTEDSLHSDESWGFVYGQSAPQERVAVFTFTRSVPTPARPNVSDDPVMLARYLKVASHEIGHSFGFAHCIYFSCIMAGAAHFEEAERRPMHLCPVCLRKLDWATNMDLMNRYRKLTSFFERYGISREAAWTQAQLRNIQGGRTT